MAQVAPIASPVGLPTVDLCGTWKSFQSSHTDTSTASVYSTFGADPLLAAEAPAIAEGPTVTEASAQTQARGVLHDTSLDPKAIADSFWRTPAKMSMVCPPDAMAKWLGDPGDLQTQVLSLFMENFNFTQTLDQAFRYLCKKLYLKAESQQIDRIISAFAQRFWQCQPDPFYGHPDAIHALTYAMLLLNTDLHLLPNHRQKMTRAAFVKNTMATLRELLAVKREPCLSAVLEEESDLLTPGKLAESGGRRHSLGTSCLQVGRSPFAMPKHRSLMDLARYLSGQSHPFQERQRDDRMEEYLKELYGRIKSQRIEQPDLPKQEGLPKAGHGRLTSASTMSSSCFFGAQSQDYEAMHGWVFVKKKSMSTWARCYLIARSGQLIFQEIQARWRLSWAAAKKDTCFTLAHGLAWQLPPYEGDFCWQEADNRSSWRFHAGTGDQAKQWVSTLNFWAALHSVAPLAGALTNVDYGWSCTTDNPLYHGNNPAKRCPMTTLLIWTRKKTVGLFPEISEDDLPVWCPPGSPALQLLTLPTPQDQLTAIHHYLQRLANDASLHQRCRAVIDKKFTFHSANRQVAITNWQAKMDYLLFETVKFEVYQHTLSSLTNT
ncbi:SEC7-like protein [Hesseltinella vesiculosa]|uniref:SEC7-like protein n=1 Tax=Hesseltinella vesiculosa TaxID=101127 RepID=A0A1X2G6R5_9FUNG|nr:SEC7-like protein [Hesseltinella vesiculosa]